MLFEKINKDANPLINRISKRTENFQKIFNILIELIIVFTNQNIFFSNVFFHHSLIHSTPDHLHQFLFVVFLSSQRL